MPDSTADQLPVLQIAAIRRTVLLPVVNHFQLHHQCLEARIPAERTHFGKPEVCQIDVAPDLAGAPVLATTLATVKDITQAILVLRGRRVLLDTGLAVLYGVTTRRLNEQVRRNLKRFPDDFLFELTTEEFGVVAVNSRSPSPNTVQSRLRLSSTARARSK
ncbi:MAG TPA: ORF6N domain-containing protein [Steroidobacteraceae bacterium]|nr:ORF6N domain-containing protein [Steroidobacteraceae bacterium]